MSYLATSKTRRDCQKSGRDVATRIGGWSLALVAGAAIGAAAASYYAAAPAIAVATARPVRFVPARSTPGSISPPGRTAIAVWRAFERTPAQAESDATAALSALRDWAKDEPEAALAFARQRPDNARVGAIIAVLEAAAANPTVAAALATDLMRDDPAHASDYGTAVVGAFVRAGDFGVALEFARSGPAADRSDWLTTIFAGWAEREPAFAHEIAAALGAGGVTGETFATVVDHWAKIAPAQAAAYAMALPAGPERELACKTSFSHWALQDPAGLAAVLPSLADPVERDAAATAFVCATDAVNRPTATALSWAEAIADPMLRERALVHVVREWAQQDPVAAANYIETAPRLTGTDRAALLGALRPPPANDDT